jgi:hypothetical protein
VTTGVLPAQEPMVPDGLKVFRKALPARRAAAEIRGWAAVAGHLPVPRLVAFENQGDQGTVVLEDVFTSGRCRVLLGDLIGEADRDPSRIPEVEDTIDAICRSLCEAAGQSALMGDCVQVLHTGRLQPGGRIDQWYFRDRPAPDAVEFGEFAEWDLRVNGRRLRFDLGKMVDRTRHDLAQDTLWMTAITQGDPTEPNIAVPLCWLDFEHAGRNILAGEAANMLWYLLGLGGWLVPRYQPSVYARTLRLALPPLAAPSVVHLEISARHQVVDLEYAWAVGAGRRAAIQRVCRWLAGDLAAAMGAQPARVYAALRPFLVLRMLGVIPAWSLATPDALLLLAKLAENEHPEMTVGLFTGTTEVPACPCS